MKTDNQFGGGVRRIGLVAAGVAGALLFSIASSPSLAETRGYAIQLIHTATYPTEGDCPKGGNGDSSEIKRRILLSRGYTEAQATAILKAAEENVNGNPTAAKGPSFDFEHRGTMNGKPVDINQFPTSEPDPQIETIAGAGMGRYAYGFDLTGHPTSFSFEDPDTHQLVENQMWRVLGCFKIFQVKLPVGPYGDVVTWDAAEDSMPAWLMSVSGADLSQDGPVTVTFDRSLDIVIRSRSSGVLSGSSYTIDPDPRNHSVHLGHIKDHVLTIDSGDFFMQGEAQFYPLLRFKQAHLRLKMMPDGSLQGLIGGYEPWLDFYHYLVVGSGGGGVDAPGVYYAMKRLADGIPDPVTGENTAISAAYYMEAVPAFVVPAHRVIAAVDRAGAHSTVLEAPTTTPEGITLVEVMRELFSSEPLFLWDRLGDAEGRTLFISDKDTTGSSSCAGQCAQEFPPLLASRGAKAFGDWSLIARSDGTRQWAYQSHALYTWVKEKKSGEVATNVAVNETPDLKLAEREIKAGSLLPPAGWQVARFKPAASLRLPDGIDARSTPSAQAVVLTDANGKTLYAFNGDARRDGQVCAMSGDCTLTWLPVEAPALASTAGDFSVVTRADGSKQWAYQSHPLYFYGGDKFPGDVHGIGVDKGWGVAEVSEDFRPRGVGIATLNGYGDVLTLNGMTLYGSYPFEKRWGGRNLRNTFTNLYAKGKDLGAAACVDQECLKTWHPFLAPADATAHGFWEPIARPDGSKQWAYKGYALYTYAGDKAPGDHSGQATYDFAKTEGSPAELKRATFFGGFGGPAGGPGGVYWNIAKPGA